MCAGYSLPGGYKPGGYNLATATAALFAAQLIASFD
jgi:hypothetical protein